MIKRKQNKKTKTSKIILRSSIALLFVSIIAQIVITNNSVVKGGEFNELKERKQALNEEISDLELEISNVSSLSALEAKAKKLGFVEYTQPIAVIEPSQFAAAR